MCTNRRQETPNGKIFIETIKRVVYLSLEPVCIIVNVIFTINWINVPLGMLSVFLVTKSSMYNWELEWWPKKKKKCTINNVIE